MVDVSSYSTAPVADALDYVAPGGTVVLAGVKGWKPIPEFISDKIVLKEIALRGAIGVTSSGYRRAIELIESRRAPGRAHAHPRLRPARRRARDPHARAPGSGRRVDPFLPAAVDGDVTVDWVRRWIEESPYTAALGVRVRELSQGRVVLRAALRRSQLEPGQGAARRLRGLARGDRRPGRDARSRWARRRAPGTPARSRSATSRRRSTRTWWPARRCCARASSSASWPSTWRRRTASRSRTPPAWCARAWAPRPPSSTAAPATTAPPIRAAWGPASGRFRSSAGRGISVEHMTGGRSRLVMPFRAANADASGGVHEGALLALLDTTGAMASWAETGPGRFKASTPALQAQILAPGSERRSGGLRAHAAARRRAAVERRRDRERRRRPGDRARHGRLPDRRMRRPTRRPGRGEPVALVDHHLQASPSR